MTDFFIQKIRKDKNYRAKELAELKRLIYKNVAYTHAGTFHADDVLSAVLLKMVNPDIEIRRVYEIDESMKDFLMFDIGFGKYDHHQNQKEKRPWKRQTGLNSVFIEYASLGKLWQVLGPELAGNAYEQMDREIISHMDLADTTGYHNPLSLLILSMNPLWTENNSDEYLDRKYMESVDMMLPIIKRYLDRLNAAEMASKIVPSLIEHSILVHGVSIIVTEQYMPIAKELISTKISFYVYKSNRGGYCVSPIRNSNGKAKYPFPEDLLGKEKNYLNNKIPGLNFVHTNGFLANTKNLKSAYELISSSVDCKNG